MKFNRELLKGNLQTIILAVLNDQPCHGYAMQKKILDKSAGIFELSEGTLYPTLHKLEKEGAIISVRLERDKMPPLRVYSLTARGKEILHNSRREWNYFSHGMSIILSSI
ncbi:MAG: PadR family transcriptional regulator [bacterium]|jgi:PadR family transcriptional regulator PadR